MSAESPGCCCRLPSLTDPGRQHRGSILGGEKEVGLLGRISHSWERQVLPDWLSLSPEGETVGPKVSFGTELSTLEEGVGKVETSTFCQCSQSWICGFVFFFLFSPPRVSWDFSVWLLDFQKGIVIGECLNRYFCGEDGVCTEETYAAILLMSLLNNTWFYITFH